MENVITESMEKKKAIDMVKIALFKFCMLISVNFFDKLPGPM